MFLRGHEYLLSLPDTWCVKTGQNCIFCTKMLKRNVETLVNFSAFTNNSIVEFKIGALYEKE